MEARGKKILTITGILEVMIGILSVIMIILLLKRGDVKAFNEADGKVALFGLLRLYVVYGIDIVAGMCAVIFSHKPKYSPILMILGFILILTIVYMYMIADASVGGLITSAIVLVIACGYFLGATLNYVSYKDSLVEGSKPKKSTKKKTK